MADAPGTLSRALGRTLGTAALAAAAILLALGIAELVARSRADPETARITGTGYASKQGNPELENLPILLTAFELSQANARGVHYGALHRTNAAGIRGPERSLRPPPDAFRVVIGGDSVVMGHGVEESDRYSDVLERMLAGATRAGTQIEVVNVGLSTLNAQQVVNRIAKIGLRYQPKLIVYGFTVNDIEGPGYRGNPESARNAHYALIGRYSESPSALLGLLWPRLVAAYSWLLPLEGSYEHVLRDNYLHNLEAWGRVAGALDTLALIARELELCVVLFQHPVMHQLGFLHPFHPVYQHVAAAAGERGFHVVNGFDAVANRDANELRFGLIDTHPNAAAHALFAETLYEGLRALPASCGVPLDPAR